MKHKGHPKDREISQEALAKIFQGREKTLEECVNNIFCLCSDGAKHLVHYTPYVNDLYDVILIGSCSECGKPASRYIETGESATNRKIIKKALKP